MIEPGQVYWYCQPGVHRRIRITEVPDGEIFAWAVDADTGTWPRMVLRRMLHDSPITLTGRPRTYGYVLEQ